MNVWNLQINEAPFFHRSIVVFVLGIFCAATLLGFTIFLDLKAPPPAQAFFGIDAAIQIAWDIAKAVAAMLAIQLASALITELISSLTEKFVIKNILYYTEALGAEQYIGNVLNKYILRPIHASEVLYDPVETNIFSIIENANLGSLGSLSSFSLAQLALRTVSGEGLTQEQESNLVRGMLAALTTQALCGGINVRILHNFSTYLATQSRGFLQGDIDPRDQDQYYGRMAQSFSMWSDPHIYNLLLPGAAQDIEQKGERASEMEMLAYGWKNNRSDDGNFIQNPSHNIAAVVESLIASQLDSALLSVDSELAHIATNLITSLLYAYISSVILDSGRVLPENPLCNQINGTEPSLSFGPGPGSPAIPEFRAPNITVNGQSFARITLGQSATVAWDAGSIEGSVEVYPFGSVARTGSRSVTPDELGVYMYELYITSSQLGGTRRMGAAALEVVEEPDEGGGGPPSGQAFITSFTADPNHITQGESLRLYWTVETNGDVGECRAYLRLAEHLSFFDVGRCASNTGYTVRPDFSTTYTLQLRDRVSEWIFSTQSVSVTVD